MRKKKGVLRVWPFAKGWIKGQATFNSVTAKILEKKAGEHEKSEIHALLKKIVFLEGQKSAQSPAYENVLDEKKIAATGGGCRHHHRREPPLPPPSPSLQPDLGERGTTAAATTLPLPPLVGSRSEGRGAVPGVDAATPMRHRRRIRRPHVSPSPDLAAPTAELPTTAERRRLPSLPRPLRRRGEKT